MTRAGTQGLVIAGAFVGLLAVVSVTFVDFDREGVRGAAIGSGLGLLNLVVGYLLIRRALRRSGKSGLATQVGGFIARLIVLVGLMILLRRTGTADPAAFALTFLVFFFVYLGVEVFVVERSLDGKRRAA